MKPVGILVVGLVLTGCSGYPVCDLDGRESRAAAMLTEPVSHYRFEVETTDEWLKPQRPIDPDTGMERDGVELVPQEAEPLFASGSCRAGVLTLDEDTHGGLVERCGPTSVTLVGLPTKLSVAVAVLADGDSTALGSTGEPLEARTPGFVDVAYEAQVGDDPACPVKGWHGVAVVDSGALVP